MSNLYSQARYISTAQYDALEQYPENPRNADGFVEDFDYDNLVYEHVNYDVADLEVSPLLEYSLGLQDAFESVNAANAGLSSEKHEPAPLLATQFLQGNLQQTAVQSPLTHLEPQMPAASAPPAATTPSAPIAGLQFANQSQARKAFAQREVAHDWQSPCNDSTIPTNQADREKYVVELMAAFVDISCCHDSNTVESFQERWVGIAEGRSPYTREQMETVCWMIIDIALALHERGPVVLHVFDDSKLRNAHKSRNLTFAKRIECICDLMRLSKWRCEVLLNCDDLDMVVAAPVQMIGMAKTNKKSNFKRQACLAAGRAKLNGKNKGKGTQAIIEDADDEHDEGRPIDDEVPALPIHEV
jgi:hypothetical protein